MGLMELFRIGKSKKMIQKILDNGAVVVDVRTPEEYNRGNVADSINIPLDEIEDHADKLKKMNVPIVLCCASGMRSGSAASILKLYEIECYNGGGWNSLG